MRWLALVGGVLVQIVLGGVYAWSLFGRALQAPEAMGLSHVLASVPFEVAIGMIFVGASIGGRLQDRSSPRVVALVGTALYAAGILLASFAHSAEQYWLLVLGYGLIGGFGLGVAYIVPVALLQKWFPERAAVVTGLAVGGFGFGATLTSPIAQHLIAQSPADPAGAFRLLGLGYLVAGLVGSAMLVSPPSSARKAVREGDFTPAQALRTPQWYLLTGTLTIAVLAGIALISMMAGAAVDVAGLDVGAAAAAVGVLALFNGGGRIAWAAVAQRVGQLPVLIAILVIEGAALLVLPHTTGMWFLALAAVVYLCYGGAFGTMPSTAGRFFGLTHAGAIYGLMLVGWSLGGVLGPLAASSLVGETGNYTLAFSVVGALAVAGVLLPLFTRPPKQAASR
ncbi:MAG TPA: OFA family MFS transporter [Arachnia sp.]|nr:OFA family MFS transporter [Arachnia sp.]HMT87342.1 OFA family MFS transporter [Arachnia sp.]